MDTLILQHSVNPNDPNGSERRLAILQRNKELLELNALKHPYMVFILFDLTREGKEFPIIANDHTLKDFLNQSILNQTIPTQIIGMSRYHAYKALTRFQRCLHKLHPNDPKVSLVIEKLNQSPPEGHFSVVVISGGKLYANLPIQGETL